MRKRNANPIDRTGPDVTEPGRTGPPIFPLRPKCPFQRFIFVERLSLNPRPRPLLSFANGVLFALLLVLLLRSPILLSLLRSPPSHSTSPPPSPPIPAPPPFSSPSLAPAPRSAVEDTREALRWRLLRDRPQGRGCRVQAPVVRGNRRRRGAVPRLRPRRWEDASRDRVSVSLIPHLYQFLLTFCVLFAFGAIYC